MGLRERQRAEPATGKRGAGQRLGESRGRPPQAVRGSGGPALRGRRLSEWDPRSLVAGEARRPDSRLPDLTGLGFLW